MIAYGRDGPARGYRICPLGQHCPTRRVRGLIQPSINRGSARQAPRSMWTWSSKGFYRMNSGASTRVIVLSSLTSTWSDGPAQSLNGSPITSPETAAAWVGLAFWMISPS
jgi:hypothetical protein